jgi:hypothetical protein
MTRGTFGHGSGAADRPSFAPRHTSHANGLSRGKPIARWGRKARDLRSADRPVAGSTANGSQAYEEFDVKPTMERLAWTVAGVARYSWVILILAALALSLGAGIKWDWD